MFGPSRAGFQRGPEAIREGFADVKRHQYAMNAAIQPALKRLLEDLSPEAIEGYLGKSAMIGRKSRAWDTYVQRWDAKAHAHDNGLLDVFLAFFSEAYDAQSKR